MASNDYYTSFGGNNQSNPANANNSLQNNLYYNNNSSRYDHDDTSYHGGPGRQDAPLPSLPTGVHNQSTTSLNPSPFKTPFDDSHSYSPYNQSTEALNKPLPHHNDPFHDSSAIPLQNQPGQGKYDGPDTTAAMGHAENYGGNKHSQEPEKKGWFKGKITYAVYVLTVVQIIVFIVEIVKNSTLTGSPIQTQPQFNPMIGPSPYVLINMGARYVPCMRQYDVPGQPGKTVAEINMPCPNTTTSAPGTCSLGELCGFGLDLTPVNGKQPQPNQWFRFILPIFLHGGLIHIAFNMLLQLTLGRDIELSIGTLRFLLVYFASGIFGFVFGGNFSPNGILSTGCSGSLFGILALVLLDLLYSWKNRRNPVRELLFIFLDIAIAFVIGLLPGLDNFSHIGGFLTGLTLGICLLHSPDALRERIGLDDPPYSGVNTPHGGGGAAAGTVAGFVKQPMGFFKGRKPLWWGWWLLRVGALVAIFIAFVVLLNNFYVYRTECKWCKYLSCLPVKNWCEIGTLQFEEVKQKRDLLDPLFSTGFSAKLF